MSCRVEMDSEPMILSAASSSSLLPDMTNLARQTPLELKVRRYPPHAGDAAQPPSNTSELPLLVKLSHLDKLFRLAVGYPLFDYLVPTHFRRTLSIVSPCSLLFSLLSPPSFLCWSRHAGVRASIDHNVPSPLFLLALLTTSLA